MYHEWQTVALESLGVLRAHGPDALAFLQGQLSNDTTLLSAQRAQLAGYHNPQGRVIALLLLLALERDEVLAILPRELADAVAARLRKYILRSKVRLTEESANWQVHGLIAPAEVAAPAGWPAQPNAVATLGQARLVCRHTQPWRWLWLAPRSAAPPQAVLPGVRAADEALWRAQLVAAGEPQVYAATSEEFVAQMLNLDMLDAIAFEKGCYTGQEVIARAHYRGRVKRRMQRFVSAAPASLVAGAGGTLGDGRGFKVVHASVRADGRCEFLAVCALASADTEAAGAAALEAQALVLPYALPE